MADDCAFCKIVAGEIPATAVYQDDDTLAFADLNPQAPTHVLVVPKQHFTDIVELSRDAKAAAAMLNGIRATAEASGLHEFRTVFNTGAQAGQSVFHVHAHVLGGRPMGWPPG
jgi:histidine triad (HIT) family protein